jgi:hypothetical protein
MPKKYTKADKLRDCYTVFKCLLTGEKVKRETHKDGSIPTHPIFDGLPEKPESEVLADCIAWCKKNGVLVWRNNTGSGTLGISGYYHYGITDGGDLIGLLPTGQHIEIECKASKGGRWSAGQMARKLEIEKSNGIYMLVHSVEELDYYYNIWLERK